MGDEPEKRRREEKRTILVQSPIQYVGMESFVSDEDAPPPVVLEPISPLPELNIEVMPKPNPHDEPEVFYEELDLKVKKYYRKRFYNEDCCTEEEFNELSQYESAKYTQDKKENKSEDSSEYSSDFQQITFEAEVHREATDTDEAESVVNNEANEEELKEDDMDDQMDLEGDTRDDGENERSIREGHDSIISGSGIMISNTDDRRKSMHSMRSSGHSSASSSFNVDFRRSRYSDFELDLKQVSALHNSTKMETTPQNTEIMEDPSSGSSDNKAATIDLPGKCGTSEDEYETYEIATGSNTDIDVYKIFNDKATTGRDSIPLDKIVDKIERRHLVPATSTPISETAIRVSEKTGSLIELSTARISSSSSSTKGTKRVLREIPEKELLHEHKRLKLNDVGVQATNDNSDWNDLNNSFFIGVPSNYKLCCCKNHICDR